MAKSKRTEPWWVCDKCNRPVKRVGKKKDDLLAAEGGHRKVCPGACYSIKQIPQSDRPARQRA